MDFKDFELVIYMDLGKNQVHILNSQSGGFEVVKADDLFEYTYKLPENTLLLGEDAHFGCDRKPKSKAQYYTSDQLLDWYAGLLKCGIVLRFFPQKMTEKYRRYAGLDKSDESDLLAIEYALKTRPHIFAAFQKPENKNFGIDLRREEADQMKEEMTEDKNIMRCGDYEENGMIAWFKNNIELIASNLPQDIKECFGIDKNVLVHRKGKHKGNIIGAVYEKQLLAILLTLMQPDGSLRLRPSTGSLMGKKYAKLYIFKMHDYHERGGVVRSDIYWHGLKNYVPRILNNKIPSVDKNGKPTTKIKPLEDYDNLDEFRVVRNAYSGHVLKVFSVIRSILVGGSVSNSEDSEFSSQSQTEFEFV